MANHSLPLFAMIYNGIPSFIMIYFLSQKFAGIYAETLLNELIINVIIRCKDNQSNCETHSKVGLVLVLVAIRRLNVDIVGDQPAATIR